MRSADAGVNQSLVFCEVWLLLGWFFTLLGGRGTVFLAKLVLIQPHVLLGWCFVGGIFRYPKHGRKKPQKIPLFKI